MSNTLKTMHIRSCATNRLQAGVLLFFLLLAGGSELASSKTNASLQELAAPCLACHSLEPDGATDLGPTLAGVAGQPIANDSNYTYSESFIRRATEGLIWNRATLDQFLEHPQSMIPGTAMSYPGVADPAARLILVEWLLSDPAGKVEDLTGAYYSRDVAVQAVLETPADLEYGEYLAGECMTCHQPADNSGKVPPIHGLTADYFIYALLEYQNGTRNNRVMQVISARLGTEELAALSAVFAQKVDQ